MRRLGIDFGSKKVGVAVTDEAGRMAFPHAVVKNDAALLQMIEDLVTERQIEEIVIGHSLNHAGEDNPIHTETKEFITDLTLRVGIPIALQPEQFTTQAAKQIQGQTDLTDASAAALILDSYLQTKPATDI